MSGFKFRLLFISLLAIPFFLQAQLIRDTALLRNMQTSLAGQKELAAGRSRQLFEIMNRPMKPEEREAMEYLYAYMPLSDLADYTGDYFLEQVQKTIQARNEMPWGFSIPEDVFLHFILPIRVNNENLDNFRVLAYDELKERIRGMDMHRAALEINHWCHEKVTYRGSDERTSSPLASVKTSFGRCGEESTFTVSAMRAAGIPARQVYTPRWAHCDDNHAWVEVWINGKWHFLGACEPDAELDMGWFAAPAMRAMLVHTRAFGWYNGNEKVIDRQAKFSELNLISNYAETRTIYVKVLDASMAPVSNAAVEYQLYNYAEFYPIAKGKTDAGGLSSITTGLGDLLIWATDGDAWAYQKITVESTDTLVLNLKKGKRTGTGESFDLVPPVEKNPPVTDLNPDLKARNAARLLEEDSIRNTYMSTFKDSTWAVQLAEQLGTDPVMTAEFIEKSYGNWMEISEFLKESDPARRFWAMQLLGAVSEKDLRDTRAYILQDHLDNSQLPGKAGDITDTAVFSNYILSGRISNEMMLPWRGFLQQQFPASFSQSCKQDISVLTDWIKQTIRIDNVSNMHSRSPLSPRGVFELKVADSHSRDIFFVALCRCMGIPARVNPATSLPQYLHSNEWMNVVFEPVAQDVSKKGKIRFVNATSGSDPAYAVNFTIGRFREGVFRTVDLDFGMKVSEFPAAVELETGDYCLVTGNRQADGSVLATLSFFEIKENELSDVKVALRETSSKLTVQGHIELKNFMFSEYGSGLSLNAAKLATGKGAILIWMDPDKEPSKHVMADLPAVTPLLEKWNGTLGILLQKDKLTSAFSPAYYNGLPSGTLYLYDVNSRLIRELSRIRKQSLEDEMPVVIITTPEGDILFLSKGYRIGIGEQLAKIVTRM